LLCETTHDFLNLLVRGSYEYAATLLNLVFALAEVVVELVNELVTLVHGRDVPLSAAVPLSFDHDSAFFRSDHFHLEASALNLCFVDF